MIPVGDNEFKRFVDHNLVTESRLKNIAIKVIKSIDLSLREKAIFEGKTKEINEIIFEIVLKLKQNKSNSNGK